MSNNPSLGPLEQQIMSCIWKLHPEKFVTVRTVYDFIKTDRKIAYTTVMTIMNRLEEKGVLKRKKKHKAHTYIPQYSQQQTISSLVGRMFQSLINQFGNEALAAFADEVHKLPQHEQKAFKKKLRKK